jgi:ubiquinone/menaquinone biosynthesis C-methylase UbiE
MLRPIPNDEFRTPEQLQEDYLIERELAAKLRSAPSVERPRLYTSLYDEMYRRIPRHPQLIRKMSAGETARSITYQMGFLRPFLRADTVFLELGSGDCALSLEVAKSARMVHAIDVSRQIANVASPPPNFRLVISDGIEVPVQTSSVTVAYSNQLMEHLHPEDASRQLRNISKVLAPMGIYLCITPNRISGPHDISKYFDDVATGFHLKEYTLRELQAAFTAAGFKSIRPYIGVRGVNMYYPSQLVVLCEELLGMLPRSIRSRLATTIPFRPLLGLRVVAQKESK